MQDFVHWKGGPSLLDATPAPMLKLRGGRGGGPQTRCVVAAGHVQDFVHQLSLGRGRCDAFACNICSTVAARLNDPGATSGVPARGCGKVTKYTWRFAAEPSFSKFGGAPRGLCSASSEAGQVRTKRRRTSLSMAAPGGRRGALRAPGIRWKANGCGPVGPPPGPHSSRTVPVQFPDSSRTVPGTVPIVKN